MPEKPQQFGYKCSWLAVKTTSRDKLIRSLRLTELREVNWTQGLESAQSATNGTLFVSPQLGPWILVIGLSLPDSGSEANHLPDRLSPLLKELGSKFDEVHYYSTHRVVDYHAWAKLAQGRVIRKFGYLGETGETFWNEGGLTLEEKRLGFQAMNSRLPGEEDVLKIAALWSIDTSFPNGTLFPAANGIIGRLPKQ